LEGLFAKRPENTIPAWKVSCALVLNITAFTTSARGQTREQTPRVVKLCFNPTRFIRFVFVVAIICNAAVISPLAFAVLIDKTGGGIAKINEHSSLGIVLLRGPARRHHGSRA
jgi:hypothetical protein